MAKLKTADDKKPAISFYSKQKVLCPVCKKEFEKEEMLSGGGRTIAGELTPELRRLYEPSAKYGKVYPFLYSVGACPNCHVAFFWNDFKNMDDKETANVLVTNEKIRKQTVETVFPHYNLKHERTLYDGAAIYYLALNCYEKMPSSYSPTIKKAVLCLRLAWICSELEKECPAHNFDYLSQMFYRKALFFYDEAIIYETDHTEDIAGIGNFGPDTDHNYGYDGVIYLCAMLEYTYGQKENIPERLKKLDQYKRNLARIFGLGKSSKNKPGPLLEHSRALYDKLSEVLKDANIISEDDDGSDGDL